MSGQPTITTADRIQIGDIISVGGIPFKVVDIGALGGAKRRIQFLGSSHVVLDGLQQVQVTRPEHLPRPRTARRPTDVRKGW